MRAASLAEPTIAAFLQAVRRAQAGDTGLWPETAITSVTDLPKFEDLPAPSTMARDALRQLAVIKLNGGLGTSMGLDQAKSLIPVKDGNTFLDYTARQLLHLRAGEATPRFLLMNSFSTQADTLAYLGKYPELFAQGPVDFLQSRVPKVDPHTFAPTAWAADPELEWCPPGHGDIYPALLASGRLEALRQQGVKYLFVSNSDNLGATADLRLLEYFARSGLGFLMEVALRTAMDKKGGHLARRQNDGRLMLRESAQCPPEDTATFQDLHRHRFFNTNNLWINLDHLHSALAQHGGTLPLPLIKNLKPVDPQLPDSPKVLQLESAMGAAIECFDQAGAITVPRTRFAPVKTTADLLAVRSDAYVVTEDFHLELAKARHGEPPLIELDPKHYQVLEAFERHFAQGVPSLINCRSLKVKGPLDFTAGVICQGQVTFANDSETPALVEARVYADQA